MQMINTGGAPEFLVSGIAEAQIGIAAKTRQVNTASQLIAHAALGCATGVIASGDCGAGAAGGVAGEVVGLVQLQAWTKKLAQLESLQGQVLSPQEAAAFRANMENDFESFKAQGVNVARLAGGLAAALTGGDVNNGANAGGNAAENNALPVIIGVIFISYLTAAGEGDPLEGLAKFGSGDNPLSKAMTSGIAKGVSLAMESYPDETTAILGVLGAAGSAIDATVEYVDDKTGNVVSSHWNDLDPKLQNQLKGSGKILSVFIPGASVKVLQKLKSTGKLPDVTKGTLLDPTEVSFSQATVSPRTSDGITIDELAADMRQNGWRGEPLNVMYRDGAPTSMDNRRLLAARRAGIEVPVTVRNPSDPLTPDQMRDFTITGQPTPTTWGEAMDLRINRQGEMRGADSNWAKRFPNGSIYDPVIVE